VAEAPVLPQARRVPRTISRLRRALASPSWHPEPALDMQRRLTKNLTIRLRCPK
jgi:phage terminase small subunit